MKKYRNRGKPKIKPDKTEFELLYYNSQIPIKELAEQYNVTTRTIYNWAYEFRKTDN